MLVSGELWKEGPGNYYVRTGGNFYHCSYADLPKFAHEYDQVTASVDQITARVVMIKTHERPSIQRRPKGFWPPPGVTVGRVTAYSNGSGLIDDGTPFERSVVKALPGAEIQVGEIVEYSMCPDGTVSRVTGPFDTMVSAHGRRIK